MTKIKDWFIKYLNLFLFGIAVVFAFIIGHILRWPGPMNKGEPRHFTAIDEFVNWYNSRFMGYWMLLKGDCDDRADYVRRCALQDGFVVSDALTLNGIYYSVQVTSTMDGHNGCLARCGNAYIYLDPNTGHFNKV